MTYGFFHRVAGGNAVGVCADKWGGIEMKRVVHACRGNQNVRAGCNIVPFDPVYDRVMIVPGKLGKNQVFGIQDVPVAAQGVVTALDELR
jgi:hypothetical protein